MTTINNQHNIEIKKGLTAKDRVRGPEIIAEDREQ